MARQRRKSKSKPQLFRFLADEKIRQGVSTATKFAAYLHDMASDSTPRFQANELRRCTVLYVASATEALCLFLLACSGAKREKVDCKYQSEITLPPDVVVPRGKLVVALQERTPIPLEEMPFAQVIGTLAHEKLIPKQLAASLDALREARNTQHLYARRSHAVSEKTVSMAFATFRDMLNVIASNTF